MNRDTRIISVGALTRVEGEGALHVTLTDGTVDTVELNIYEPPRFFEGLLRGRAYTEPPDITARICGICPVAYQVSACNAIEDACGVTLDDELRALRRLLYCGEWINSHALHIYLLHLPDFLGYPDALTMAKDHPGLLERGLNLKRVGNRLLEQLGGRPIHPVNVRLGGFYRTPTRAELAPMAESLRHAMDDALATVAAVGALDFPDLEVDHEFLALAASQRYPIDNGDITRSTGAGFTAAEFGTHVVEQQVPHSTALHATLDGGRYLTGPLARYSLNSAALSPAAASAAASAGLGSQCRNPFRSIVVRAVEIVYAVDEALRIIEEYQRPPRPSVPVTARAATGHGVSEAPRGLLYHRYEIGPDDTVRAATIVPPTSQNQAAIEHELAAVVGANASLDDTDLAHLCERTIRNHDPCISCAAHFLTLTVQRR
ncbi:coenzyme F420-reducing hydrogenase, alpha subunit [Mycolicibacterium chubuense NBB4]|uniref:Coenzyme F420-reducing hydrogenase, alpha subunit n=1 Tax=Mycolicibacterium chubuense (strain NBB4) TaxID=710421 RepID=I4BGT3_MYCCN|nr:nickel-dependent hydrogenase large subunit [Mycolicibacterium chubuense]AFM16490.1 coenzyme F420-reducing hydrogenase, alpha subunit [Mycolicibacterium chubuense NBB4]